MQYIDNKMFLCKHFEASAACLSQTLETGHEGFLRKRTASSRFTEHQLFELKKRFKSHPYITGKEKQLMAENLGTTQAAVTNWFCTERKLRRKFVNKARNATVATA